MAVGSGAPAAECVCAMVAWVGRVRVARLSWMEALARREAGYLVGVRSWARESGPHSSETVGVLSIGGRIVSHAGLQDDAPEPAAEDPALPQQQEPSKREEDAQVLARAPLHALMSAFGCGLR